MKDALYCPVHGDPHTEGKEWPCPLSDDEKTCRHFEAELARRVRDATRNGNFFELLPDRNKAGERMLQEYRDHQPFGEPQPLPHRYH